MEKEKKNQESPKLNCGIIMPISEHSDYQNGHWKDVLSILVEAIKETQFDPRLVSDDVAIGLIHERIVNNIYTDAIVICDVSSKNPNVMFELGMRLAFDKPTIIIKDEKTGYSFDTGVIEHITYPSSLRFTQIVEFKQELIKKINATYSKSQSEQNYSPFLKSFGKTIVPAKIQQTEIAESKYILSKLESLSTEIKSLRYEQNNVLYSDRSFIDYKNSSERQKMANNSAIEFFERNSHVTQDEYPFFLDIISDEIKSKYGLKATPAEITTAVDNHFMRVKKKGIIKNAT